MQPFRLILDESRSATLNMAVDEYLVNSQLAKGAGPILRFYSWDEPSITLGYFQKIEDAVRKFGAREKNIPVVRRISGGGAVRHGEDLTFSLVLKTTNPFFPTDVKSSYRRIHEAIRVGLKGLYPKLDYADCRLPAGRQGTVLASKRQSGERVCFESPACDDLLLEGKKILGASQRRIGKNLLHQSSIFLGETREGLIRNILSGFESLWKVGFEEKPLSEEELMRARELEEKRYGSPEWARPVVTADAAAVR